MTHQFSHLFNIRKSGKYCGRINLVKYRGQSLPHLEFEIEEKFRGKGIMSKELPKYLKWMKSEGQNRLLAVVKQDNIASQKLLEKNHFHKIATFETTFSYAVALDLVELIQKHHEEIMKNIKL